MGVTNFSICYWLKIDSSASYSEWADIWQVGSKAGNTTSIIRDELRNANGYSAVHFVKDAEYGGNTNPYYGIFQHKLAADKWCHVAVTKDDNNVKEYLNGNLVATVACSIFEASP